MAEPAEDVELDGVALEGLGQVSPPSVVVSDLPQLSLVQQNDEGSADDLFPEHLIESDVESRHGRLIATWAIYVVDTQDLQDRIVIGDDDATVYHAPVRGYTFRVKPGGRPGQFAGGLGWYVSGFLVG